MDKKELLEKLITLIIYIYSNYDHNYLEDMEFDKLLNVIEKYHNVNLQWNDTTKELLVIDNEMTL